MRSIRSSGGGFGAHAREGRFALSRVIRRISQLCIALRLHTFGQVAADKRAQTRGESPERCAGLGGRPWPGRGGRESNEKESLCVWDSCADERERERGCNCNLYLLLSAGRMGIVLQERNELSLYEARRANGNRYF